MARLMGSERLVASGDTLSFVRYLDDFAFRPVIDIWDDTRTSGFGEEKIYVVQTNNKVIERCLLMTTDVGDLVLDPTCGSGTTAFVAEQWGRRWITAAFASWTCIEKEGSITLERISIDPTVMNGQPCVRGTRLTVKRVLHILADYKDRDELHKDYPRLDDEDIRQALLYAAASVDDRIDDVSY